jgi:hypothetical protein
VKLATLAATLGRTAKVTDHKRPVFPQTKVCDTKLLSEFEAIDKS